MIIKSLELSDFRNYESLCINFDRGVNILFGDNAQGKTNILEAIYVSATTKSHKSSKDKDIITSVNGKSVSSNSEIANIVSESNGEAITIEFIRDDENNYIYLVLPVNFTTVS